ncbi:nucleotide pyrophosphatase [Schleiferilactobacillus perolens DSM 12744]|uniref:Nucleotide pyrophosphatase n=1 Tax=Schleiferilactobacillus perolens DSM 12744 TaxID=1423792 RepID=A0A0R1N977_9LACO|nr:nucleotide pyrophosphatase [Schleiferilactobacillus perolens DSM 12744]
MIFVGNRKQKLVVVSLDAMGAADLTPAALKDLPNLAALIKAGTHVQQVRGVYPTLTYPSHTSIITGMYPRHHGIVNNTKIQPERLSPDWYWYRKDVHATPLYQVAKEAGMTTAAFLWPVTARSGIDYNIAEIFPNRIWTNQVLISLWASSPLFILRLNAKYGHLRNGIHQPQLDDFVTAAAVDTIVRKQPDLTLIHLVDMDSQRHAHGVTSPEAMAARKRLDARLGKIIQATKDAHMYTRTSFAVLGDHYQINVHTMIRLNALFRAKGWQRAMPDGMIAPDWRVLAKSGDGSTYIYVRDRNAALEKEIADLIAPIPGIEHVYSQGASADFGADPRCTFLVEAQAGFYFIDDANGAITEKVDPADIGQPERYRAVHGYSPFKPDYATTLILAGEGIKQNFTVPHARLIDEGPTFAKVLGLQYPYPTDGEAIADAFE